MKRVAQPIAVSMVLVFVICMLITFMTGCTSAAKKKRRTGTLRLVQLNMMMLSAGSGRLQLKKSYLMEVS